MYRSLETRRVSDAEDILDGTSLVLLQIFQSVLNSLQTTGSHFKRMSREFSLLQTPADPAAEQETQVPAVVSSSLLVSRADQGVGCNGGRQVWRAGQNVVDIASGSDNGSQHMGALLQNDGVQCMSDLRPSSGLPDVLDGLFGSIAIVDNAVTFARIQELLSVVCSSTSHTNDGMDVALLRELDSKCTNSCAGTIHNEGNGILRWCPGEGQRQVVIKRNDSSQPREGDSCSFC